MAGASNLRRRPVRPPAQRPPRKDRILAPTRIPSLRLPQLLHGHSTVLDCGAEAEHRLAERTPCTACSNKCTGEGWGYIRSVRLGDHLLLALALAEALYTKILEEVPGKTCHRHRSSRCASWLRSRMRMELEHIHLQSWRPGRMALWSRIRTSSPHYNRS